MDKLEKRKGREKRTNTFLSFLDPTIPGTVWRTYVHVQGVVGKSGERGS